MNPIVLALFVLGLVLLVVGAEVLVRGASSLALRIGISPIVVGLTVVAFGTSAPEMAVSTKAALSGQEGADIAMGNVIGSNIFNILLILGLSAIISPLVVAHQFVRKEVPVMIGVSILVWLMALDGGISRLEGAALFAGIIIYTGLAVVSSRRENQQVKEEYAKELHATPEEAEKKPPLIVSLLFVAVGLGMLVLGSRWLVDGAIEMARMFGISELIIGLTIVAAGTSLPEVATSVIASLKGEREIAVGNVVGSNIFNLLSVLGLAALVAPSGINVQESAVRFDLPVMIACAVACLPIFFTGFRISRWEGFLFLGYYIAYTVYLILHSSRHEALSEFTGIMLWAVIPGTILALLASCGADLFKPKMRSA